MRLPDRSDGELVGKAANLNEDQIEELAKLPCGVAVVYQNEWLQPVLCKICYYKPAKSSFSFTPETNLYFSEKNHAILTSLLKCIMENELLQKDNKQHLKKLKNSLLYSILDSQVKIAFLEYLQAEPENNLKKLSSLVYDFLEAEKAIQNSVQYDNIQEWTKSVITKLTPSVSDFSRKQIAFIMALILHEKTFRDSSYQDIYHAFTEMYQSGGGAW